MDCSLVLSIIIVERTVPTQQIWAGAVHNGL